MYGQVGSGQLGDFLRALSGGKQAAYQVAYINKYGSSSPPPQTDTDIDVDVDIDIDSNTDTNTVTNIADRKRNGAE